MDCTVDCSKNNKTIAQVYGKHLGYEKNFYEYKDWPCFLEKFFHPINRALNYRYFEFNTDNLGVILLKEKTEEKNLKEETILKDNLCRFSKNEVPSIFIPNGLDEGRKKYLFKEIRGFVRCPEKRNSTCPKPE